MDEVWKDVPSYENIYQISNLGHVRRWRKKYKRFDLLKLNLDPKGYYKVMLSKDSVVKKYWVHSLVAVCFLNHTPNGTSIVIDHIDDNKLNNVVNNLQLIPNRTNINKGFKSRGTKSGIVGSKKLLLKNGDVLYEPSISINKILIRFNREKDANTAAKIYELSVDNLGLFSGNIQEFKNLIYNLI